MWKRIFILVFVLIILAGCGKQSTLASSPTPLQPTKTPTVTFTPTQTPTKTSTPVRTATWTPLPTISPNDFSNVFLNLLNSNAGCELPCWLGITPGKTTTLESIHFFSQFPIEIGELSVSRTGYPVRSSYGLSIVIDNILVAYIDINSREEIVDSTFIRIENYRKNYQLDQILNSFGKPNRIYIFAQQSAPMPVLAPTVLLLDYNQHGLIVEYYYPAQQIGDNLQVCFKAVETKLHIWNLDTQYKTNSAEEYMEGISGGFSMSIEEATNFSIDSFYDSFLKSDSETCLETPANLWP